MFDFYEKRKMKRWFYSWPFLIILLIISVLLGHGVWGVYQQEYKTRVNKNQRLAHLGELEDRKEALEEEIARLSTERGIEEEIRQKFEVAKEGEGVIVIVDPPLKELEADIGQEKGFFRKLFDSILF